MIKTTSEKAPTDLLCRLPNPFKWHSLFQIRRELSIHIYLQTGNSIGKVMLFMPLCTEGA